MTINKSFFLLTLVVVLVLYAANTATHGMFTDGMIYSTIAYNMHLNAGSIWNPYFSDFIMDTFHEHPMLAIWLQSWTYKLFGNAFWVDKIYQFLMLLLNIAVIVSIWKTVMKKMETAWLPIILWLTIGKVIWSFNNNCLENTLCFFSLLAVLTLLKQHLNKSKILVSWLFSSILIWFAFLSKGFPGLFPLGIYFALLISLKGHITFKQFIGNSLGLVGVFSTIGFLFFYFNEAAYINISTYINKQVLQSIAGERIIVSRTWILEVLLKEFIPIFILLAVYFTVVKVKKLKELFVSKQGKQWALFFFILGLMASLPIMVSPKQLSFYAIPSTPYFVLAAAILLHPIIQLIHQKWSKTAQKRFAIGVIALCFGSVVFTVLNAGKYVRNKEMLQDLALIAQEVNGNNQNVVMLSPALIQEWSLMAFLKRYYNINTNRSGELFPYRIARDYETALDNYTILPHEYQSFRLEKQNPIAE
jgi:hypothetical protein